MVTEQRDREEQIKAGLAVRRRAVEATEYNVVATLVDRAYRERMDAEQTRQAEIDARVTHFYERASATTSVVYRGVRFEFNLIQREAVHSQFIANELIAFVRWLQGEVRNEAFAAKGGQPYEQHPQWIERAIASHAPWSWSHGVLHLVNARTGRPVKVTL